MKKFSILFCFLAAFIFSSCFDTTQEITLNADGSGILKNSNDMSTMLGLAKQMGGSEATGKLGDKKIDSSFSLSRMLDSSTVLTAEEKALVKNGSVHINLDAKADKFIHTMILPFSNMAEIDKLNEISDKLMQEIMEKQMGKMPDMGMEEMPEESSVDDYFKVTYGNGVIVKELNAEKYKDVEKDEFLKGMKEATAMGIPMTMTYVINLPAKAKNVEGKNVKTSADGKQVTVKASIEDFFEDPSKFAFKIEY